MSLPSRFQIGTAVVVNFGTAGVVFGEVSAAKFSAGIVFYDVDVYPFTDEPNNMKMFITLKDIKSYYVEDPQDRFKKPEASGFNGCSNVGLKLNNN